MPAFLPYFPYDKIFRQLEISSDFRANCPKIYGILFVLFTNLFKIDKLQILRFCIKLKNTIAYHTANLHQRTKYIIHTNINHN